MNDNKTATEISHATRGHHPYSPSTLQAREVSPCFKPREDATPNEASLRGTAQHEAVEALSDAGLNDEEAEAVAKAVSMVDNLKALIRQYPFEELTEVYLPIDDEKITAPSGEVWEGTTAGYPDRAIIWRPEGYAEDERHAAIFDWKFGRYAVASASQNRQGHSYMLGLRRKLRKEGLRLRTCQVTFFSPHRNEDPTSFVFAENVLDPIYAELVAIVRRSEAIDKAIESRGFSGLTADERALMATSPKCIFCARLGTCPLVGGLAADIARQVAPLEAPRDIRGFNELDPAELAKGVIVGGIVSKWATEYRGRVVQRALDHPEDPRYVPDGYKLSCSYPRKVAKPAKLLAWLRKRFGPKVVSDNITIPLTVFEKIISEQAPRGTKTAEVDKFKTELADNGFTVESTVPVVSLRMK